MTMTDDQRAGHRSALPGGGDGLGKRLGAVHPVPGDPARAAQDHLHTNAIESLIYQRRKIIKNRGHFPNDDAAIKLLWLAIRDIEDKRARALAKEKSPPANEHKAPGRLVEGAVVQDWKQALGSLALACPESISPYLTSPTPRPTYTGILTGPGERGGTRRAGRRPTSG